jgi:hypothetical protein
MKDRQPIVPSFLAFEAVMEMVEYAFGVTFNTTNATSKGASNQWIPWSHLWLLLVHYNCLVIVID